MSGWCAHAQGGRGETQAGSIWCCTQLVPDEEGRSNALALLMAMPRGYYCHLAAGHTPNLSLAAFRPPRMTVPPGPLLPLMIGTWLL